MIHYQTLDLIWFLMCAVNLNIGIISGTTHIKTNTVSRKELGKHFLCNSLCSSDGCHVTHSCFSLICNKCFHKPPERKIRSGQIWRTKGPSPSYPMIGKPPVLRGTNKTGEVKWSTPISANTNSNTLSVSFRSLSQRITDLKMGVVWLGYTWLKLRRTWV
jgi:hypothetical protein